LLAASARMGASWRCHFLDLDKYPSEPEVVETRTRFISLELNRSIVFEGNVVPVRTKGIFTFGQADGATTLSVRIDELNPVGPLKLLSPLLARMGQRIWTQRLTRIKTLLEASSSQPSDVRTLTADGEETNDSARSQP
jgi:hypothetical protein